MTNSDPGPSELVGVGNCPEIAAGRAPAIGDRAVTRTEEAEAAREVLVVEQVVGTLEAGEWGEQTEAEAEAG